ncbi:hypothetical protein J7432_03275 [Xanthomonas axonopodis pv. begoniae]|nr:hypothetical protein [Xanthomonas axonopodis pv. begoniae]MBO9771055.1 hypothetical protein [Xanthomonas axonopodis pv. begoniae]
MFLKYTDVFFDLQAAPRGRYASLASVSGIGGNGDPGAMATCAVVQAALAARAMMESSIGVTIAAIAWAGCGACASLQMSHRSMSMRYNGDRTFCEPVR